MALGTNLKYCTSVAKGLKLKVRKFWGPNPTFVEVTGEKLVGGAFLPPPSWTGLNIFHLHATNINVTLLQDRIRGFLLKELTEDVSESRFSIEYERWESSNENTDHFANVWMAALAPFAPS